MKVEFFATCVASYNGELELPNNIDTKNKKEVLAYILDHLDEVPCNKLEWINDTEEPVIEEDILYIGK